VKNLDYLCLINVITNYYRMKVRILLSLLFFVCFVQAQEIIPFAKRDTGYINMAVYYPEKPLADNPCVVYMFGGGFIQGSYLDSVTTDYCRKMSDVGFIAVAVDYRLGFKNVEIKSFGLSIVPKLERAIHFAVEDCADAVAYLLKHSDELGINPERIMLAGSSAGAITVLQTDYFHCNGHALTECLPDSFRFAAVMAYSGAIFSREGKADYKYHSPAPTLMFHGTKDKIVTYNSITFGNLGFFGANTLVKRFDKYRYPYLLRRYKGLGHEVALSGNKTIDDTLWFYERFVVRGERVFIDETYEDETIAPLKGYVNLRGIYHR
jgi:predicted esterase